MKLFPLPYVQILKYVINEGENFCMNNLKKIIFWCGVTLIFVVISGCSGNTEAKTPTSSSSIMPVSTATRESTTAPISTAAVLSTQQPTKATESMVYENTKYNFILKIPKSWNGKYDVEENGDNLRFVYKANNGTLFSITIWSKEKWNTDGAELVKNIHISKIGEKGDKIYTLSTPTDVQVVPSDKKMAADYNSMWEDIEGIKATFELK
jgi:hypothetical protein